MLFKIEDGYPRIIITILGITFKIKKEYLYKPLCYLIRHLFPINENKIVLTNFGGSGYACNLKSICNELLKRKRKYKIIWLLKNEIDIEKAEIPKGIIIANNNILKLYHLMTSKIWINNIHFSELIQLGLRKRKGQIFIQTFHGGITLKKIGRDNHSYISPKESNNRKNNFISASYVDYLISANEKEDHVLHEFTWDNGEILHFGDARCDILYSEHPEIRQKILNRFNLPNSAKLLLYMPTYRPKKQTTDAYTLDYEKVINSLENKTGQKWYILLRLHPRELDKVENVLTKSDRLINVSNYVDMQELMVASDMMISDYSSSVTDFMLTRKPAFLFVPDLQEYIEKRGLYYDIDTLPFPYSETVDGLIEKMNDFNDEEYKNKVDQFLKDIKQIEDGKASERIVDFIEEKMR